MGRRGRGNSRVLVSAMGGRAEGRGRLEGVVTLGLAFDVNGMLHSYQEL